LSDDEVALVDEDVESRSSTLINDQGLARRIHGVGIACGVFTPTIYNARNPNRVVS
jgi:hypothetical protein